MIGDVTPEGIEAVKIMLDAQKQILEAQMKASEAKRKVVEVQPTPYSPLLPDVKPGPAIWRNKDADEPVTVKSYAGERDGRHFVYVAESAGGIPLDEITYQQ